MLVLLVLLGVPNARHSFTVTVTHWGRTPRLPREGHVNRRRLAGVPCLNCVRYGTNKYFIELTKTSYDEVNLQKQTVFGIISDITKMKDFPTGKTSLTFFLLARCLPGGGFALTFAFFSAGIASITSISEPELTVDALRLPGCLLSTDDRSMSKGSSDREADPRVSDCCDGLCNRDDVADWRDKAGDVGDILDAQLGSRA